MSDSDDTDILLLIPPNFFFNESNLNTSFDYNLFESKLQEKTITTSLCRSQNFESGEMDQSKCPDNSFEYRKFNTSPHAHLKSPNTSKLTEFPSSTPIDVYKSALENEKKVDSVEKYFSNISLKNKNAYPEPISIVEASRKVSPLSNLMRTPINRFQRYGEKQTEDDILKSLTSNRMSDWNTGVQRSTDKNDQLIDMNSIWQNEEEKMVSSILAKSTPIDNNLIKIGQLENIIESLRFQLNQYEAKHSETLKMEQTKNNALKHLHAANTSLMTNLSQMGTQLASLELRSKEENDILKLENVQLRSKIKNLQENNDILEQKSVSLLRTTNEVREVSQKQLEDFEIRLTNAQQTERALRDEIGELKLHIATMKNENDSDKFRANSLRKKVIDLQKLVDEYCDRELHLKKDIEEQRNYLKSYYQKQLDVVVNKKRDEYQIQLDNIEESIRCDAKKTERNIAEQAIKQIELINQKHEQELALIEEKHEREIELYRIQLGSATKLISQLEKNLFTYKEKRNDISERLQDAVQWRKSMDVIGKNDTTSNLMDPKTKQFLKELSEVVADEDDFKRKTNIILSKEIKNKVIKSNEPKLLNNIEFD